MPSNNLGSRFNEVKGTGVASHGVGSSDGPLKAAGWT